VFSIVPTGHRRHRPLDRGLIGATDPNLKEFFAHGGKLIFGCGTVVKLLREGYTGYFIRTSNDEKDSYDLSLGETVVGNERDVPEFLKACGLKQALDYFARGPQ
jgi:hypothetical protein